MRKVAAAVVVLVLVTSGCATTIEAAMTDDDKGVTSTRTPKDGRVIEVHGARADLLARDVIDFTYTMRLGPIPVQDFAGTYRWRPEGWAVRGGIRDPATNEPPISLRATSSDGAVWMHMDDWARACWLRMPVGEVPVGLLALLPGQPQYVSFLAGLRRQAHVDPETGVITGRVGLSAALRILHVQLLTMMDVKNVDFGRRTIPVVMELDGKRLASLTIRGEDLVRGVTTEDIEMPEDLAELLRTAEFAVSYPVDALQQPIERPTEVCAQA